MLVCFSLTEADFALCIRLPQNAAVAALLTLDPTRCPLCGSDNRCALEIERATGAPQPPCWCMGKPLDAAAALALRERIPEAARGLACVCAACMAQLLAVPESHS